MGSVVFLFVMLLVGGTDTAVRTHLRRVLQHQWEDWLCSLCNTDECRKNHCNKPMQSELEDNDEQPTKQLLKDRLDRILALIFPSQLAPLCLKPPVCAKCASCVNKPTKEKREECEEKHCQKLFLSKEIVIH